MRVGGLVYEMLAGVPIVAVQALFGTNPHEPVRIFEHGIDMGAEQTMLVREVFKLLGLCKGAVKSKKKENRDEPF